MRSLYIVDVLYMWLSATGWQNLELLSVKLAVYIVTTGLYRMTIKAGGILNKDCI